jgi:hypothetical protein
VAALARSPERLHRLVGFYQSFGIDLLPTAFIKALTKLLEALIKAPIWLALVIIGIILIFGSNLI